MPSALGVDKNLNEGNALLTANFRLKPGESLHNKCYRKKSSQYKLHLTNIRLGVSFLIELYNELEEFLMNFKKIKLYAFIGLNLGGVIFLICQFYIEFIANYINVNMMFGILSILGAILLGINSKIYYDIKDYPKEDELNK